MNLSHRNIVQIFDLGKLEEGYFIAMEFIDGADLRRLLERCGAASTWPSMELGLHLAIEALRGLDYAHRRVGPDGRPLGLVHRDVSRLISSVHTKVR